MGGHVLRLGTLVWRPGLPHCIRLGILPSNSNTERWCKLCWEVLGCVRFSCPACAPHIPSAQTSSGFERAACCQSAPAGRPQPPCPCRCQVPSGASRAPAAGAAVPGAATRVNSGDGLCTKGGRSARPGRPAVRSGDNRASHASAGCTRHSPGWWVSTTRLHQTHQVGRPVPQAGGDD